MTATGAAQTWNDSTTSTSSDLEEGDLADPPEENGSLADDQMDIDMAVTSSVELDVKPENLNYPNMDVGSRQVNSERNFVSLSLQNTGSEYIDRIWVESSTPSSDPFRTGESTGSSTDGGAHDAGNFMQVRPQTAEDTALNDSIYRASDAYHFINRKEFAFGSKTSGGTTNGEWDQVPDFIEADPETDAMNLLDFSDPDLSSGDNPQVAIEAGTYNDFSSIPTVGAAQEVWVGTMRVANRDYYWALLSDTEGQVAGSGVNSELRIADATYADKVANNEITEPGDFDVAYHDDSTFGAYDFTDGGANNEPIRWRVYDVSWNSDGTTGVGMIEDLVLRGDTGVLNFNGDSTSDGTNNNGEDRRYDVLVNSTSSDKATLTRTRFNPVPPSVRNSDAQDLEQNGYDSAIAQFMFDAPSESNMLMPGQSIAVDTAIEVPRGVVQGQVTTGTLTIALTSDNTATPGQDAEQYIHTSQ